MTDDEHADALRDEVATALRAAMHPDSLCLHCKAGFHNECDLSFDDVLEDGEECCCKGAFSIELYRKLDADLKELMGDDDDKTHTAGIKDPSEIRDKTSTGRKRAKEIGEIMLPIYKGTTVCTWAGLLFPGGGPIPIMGCEGNLLVGKREINDELREQGFFRGDYHHGPDKNTLSNAPNVNLWLICTVCHNRWHAVNNPLYGKRPDAGKPFLPSVPYWAPDLVTPATPEQRAIVEEWWATPAKHRPAYPILPTTKPILPTGEAA